MFSAQKAREILSDESFVFFSPFFCFFSRFFGNNTEKNSLSLGHNGGRILPFFHTCGTFLFEFLYYFVLFCRVFDEYNVYMYVNVGL